MSRAFRKRGRLGHVGAGQQHLADVEVVEVEQALPDVASGGSGPTAASICLLATVGGRSG